MEITLIRHLPTAWNAAGLLQGQRDIPMLPYAPVAFASQITKNQRHLQQSGPFDIVMASSLRRAQQTAHVYGYQNPVIEPLLNEMDFGTFEGKPKEALINHFGEDWYAHPENIVLGEGFIDLAKRVLAVLYHYKYCKHVLIFGHGSWIRALLSIHQWGNIDGLNQLKFDNNACIQCNLELEGERDASTLYV